MQTQCLPFISQPLRRSVFARDFFLLSQILRLASVLQMRLPAALKWLRRRQEAERVQLYKHTAHPLQQSRCGTIANPIGFEKTNIFGFPLLHFFVKVFLSAKQL